MLKSVFKLRTLALLTIASLMLLTSACTKVEVNTNDDDLPSGMLKEAAPDLSKRPDGLANEFLNCIKKGKYEKAYTYLNSEAQGNISRETFVSQLNNYMATASSKQMYQNRVVSSERIKGKTGTVRVTDMTSPNTKAWIWEFEEDYAGWKIRSLDLPPVSRYKERYSY